MKNYIWVLFLMLISCSKSIEKIDIRYLNGYWEIEKVVLPNGESREYKINESIDFFEINDSLKGFRKKLIPQFDGKFLTNEVYERFSIEKQKNLLFITYKTDFAFWKEEILKLTNDNFEVKNQQGIHYYYKRSKKNE